MLEIIIIDTLIYGVGELLDHKKWMHVLEFAVVDAAYQALAWVITEKTRWKSDQSPSNINKKAIGIYAVGKVALVAPTMYAIQRLAHGHGNLMHELLKVLAVGAVDAGYIYSGYGNFDYWDWS